MENKYCKDCGKKINRADAIRCRKCAKQEKLNPAYIDGLGRLPYPLKFFKIRDKIRDRDNHFCQNINCQCNKKENHQELTVHHIDYNKFNCKETNLITVCHKCNVKINVNRDYWYAYFTYIMEQIYGT